MAAPELAEVAASRYAEARSTGKLNFGYLGITELPHDFVDCALAAHPRLHELDLSSNALTFLPAELSKLTTIHVLRLKYNCLIALPPVVATLPRLEVLEVDGNRIAELDGAVLSACTALRTLNLSSNGLCALPEECGPLPALEKLALGNNALAALPGTFPTTYPGLTQLDISSCQLCTLPAGLAALTCLQRLDAKNNLLEKVPPQLGLLPNLKTLDLRNCGLVPRYQQAADKGLARFLAFLKDEIEVERLAEIERNRPKSIQEGPCTVYRCRTSTEDVTQLVQEGGVLEAVGGIAWIRTGHTLAQRLNLVYMFGGTVVKDGRKSGELLVLDTDTMAWRRPNCRGEAPCPRDGHVMVLDEHTNRLWVAGGKKENGRRLNDLHFCDLYTWTWHQPKTDGDPPCPRDQASATTVGRKLVLFGGRTYGARLTDLHTFDLDSFAWEHCPAAGTVPPPRQGAALVGDDEGRLWLHGGQGHFVCDDLYCYDFHAEEWTAAVVEGRARPARVGHILTFCPGGLRLFGGLDQLGNSWVMWRLRKLGANKFEWVETAFSMQQNRSRACLFNSVGELNVMQVGHPLHGLPTSKEQIGTGLCVYDVFQTVRVADVPDRSLAEADLAPVNAKQQRIAMTLEERRHRLPPSVASNSAAEAHALEAAAAFAGRWATEHPWRPVPWLAAPNEARVEKLVCCGVRRTVLPHTELYDLAGVCRLLAEFFTYEPLEMAGQPPVSLVSPAAVLEWQAGDAFDLATLGCSLLLGAGYRAYVAVGWTTRAVALDDCSRAECGRLAELGMPPPAYAELPAEEVDLEPDPEAAAVRAAAREAAAAAAQAAAEAAAAAAAAGEQAAALTGAGQPLEPIAEEAAPATASRPATLRSKAAGSRPATGRSTSPAKSPAKGAAKPKVGAKPATPAGKRSANAGGMSASKPGTAKSSADGSQPASGAGKKKAGASLPVNATAAPEHQSAEPVTAAQEPADANGAADGTHAAHSAHEAAPGDGAASAGAPPPAGAPEEEESTPPMRPKRYMHAWIVVRPGRRDVSEVLLIDPATGTCYSAASSPCSGIEWLWDDTNYYVSIQQTPTPVSAVPEDMSISASPVAALPGTSSSRLPVPGATDWNVRNPNAWLALLPQQQAAAENDARTTVTELSSVATALRSSQSCAAALVHSASGLPAHGSASMRVASRQFATPRDGAPAATSVSTAPVAPLQRYTSVPLHVLTARGGGTPRLGVRTPEATGLSSLSYLAPDESAGPPGLEHSPTTLAACGHGAAATALEAQQLPAGPELPPSWVPRLALAREALDVRCPRGSKVVAFRQAQRELFAEWGDIARWDGLVERVTTFADPERTQPLCVVELFARRRDALERRESWPAQRLVRESFGPGAAACLRRSELIKGGRRELAFYHDSRADALMRRIEEPGVSREDWFAPWPDGLASRTVHYVPPGRPGTATLLRTFTARRGSAAVLTAAAVGALPAATKALQRLGSLVSVETDRPIEKITDCYRWQSDGDGKPAAAGAADQGCLVKRTFWLQRRQLKVVVRAPDGSLVSRKYDADAAQLLSGDSRSGAGQEGIAAAASPALSAQELEAEWATLKAAARDAEEAAQRAAEESEALLAARRAQEQGVALATGHCDAARVKVEDSGDEGAGAEDEAWDELARHLPNTGARDITAAEAAAARDSCMAALAERLAHREALVRSRVEEEGAELARLQASLAGDRHRMGAAEAERLESAAAQTAFRLSVARRRLEGHAAHAAARTAELAGKLAADKRLVAALTGSGL